MIKLVVARYNGDEKIYNKYIAKSIENLNVDAYESHGTDGLAKKYNSAIEAIVQSKLKKTDVVCFVHSDVFVLDKEFIEKVELIFSKRPDIGILGVIGTTEFNNTGAWWANTPDKLRGHIIQVTNNNKDIHLVKGSIGFFDNMVAIDGLIMMFNAKTILDGFRFDENTFEGFDMYDIDASFTVLNMGYKIACADILVQHRSIGEGVFKSGWKTAKQKLFNKWNGLKFPYSLTSK